MKNQLGPVLHDKAVHVLGGTSIISTALAYMLKSLPYLQVIAVFVGILGGLAAIWLAVERIINERRKRK